MSFYRDSYGGNKGRNSYGSYNKGGRGQRFGDPEPISQVNEPIDSFNKNFLSVDINESEQAVSEFRRENEMKIFGENIPAPAFGFDKAGFEQEIVDFFTKTKKYEKTNTNSVTGMDNGNVWKRYDWCSSYRKWENIFIFDSCVYPCSRPTTFERRRWSNCCDYGANEGISYTN